MNTRGLTLAELLIALAVFAILGALGIGGFSEYRRSAALLQAKNTIFAQLTEARSKTLASDSNSAYGVHFEELQTIFFKGSVYSSSNTSNKIAPLPPGTRINSILLGGATDIVFKRLTGETGLSSTGRIVLANSGTGSSTINIYPSGFFE